MHVDLALGSTALCGLPAPPPVSVHHAAAAAQPVVRVVTAAPRATLAPPPSPAPPRTGVVALRASAAHGSPPSMRQSSAHLGWLSGTVLLLAALVLLWSLLPRGMLARLGARG
jgi:hypothetical protein